MKRKLFQVFLVILLCLTLVPAVAAAETDEMTNEELFAAYVEQVFYGDDDLNLFSVGSNSAGAKLTGNTKKYYDALVPVIKQIANGSRANATVRIGKSGTGSEIITDLEGQAVDFDAGLLVDALLVDFPYEMYWYDKVTGTQYAYNTPTSTFVEFYFNVAGAYQKAGADQYTVDTAKTGAPATAADNANAIVAANASKSDYEKLVAYKEAICGLVDYNYPAADDNTTPYGDPWQMIWVFDGKPETKVVCEGYSKAFQYLCDKSSFSGNISCYTVTGEMWEGEEEENRGAHMWNIVTMENGKNYFVDVTNSDTGSIGQEGELFLAGAPLKTGMATRPGEIQQFVVPLYQITANSRLFNFRIEPDSRELWKTGPVDDANIWPSMGILKLATSKYVYTPSTCAHTYVWQNNDSQHWQECSKCHERIDQAAHTYTMQSDSTKHWDKCSCGKIINQTAHSYVQKSNSADHWDECSCGMIKDQAAHGFKWKYASDKHWQECTKCSYATDKVSHKIGVWGMTNKRHYPTCADCGYGDVTVGIPHNGDPCKDCSYSKNGAAVSIADYEKLKNGNIRVYFRCSQMNKQSFLFSAASYDINGKLIDVAFSMVLKGMDKFAPTVFSDRSVLLPAISGLDTAGAAKIVIFPILKSNYTPLGESFKK